MIFPFAPEGSYGGVKPTLSWISETKMPNFPGPIWAAHPGVVTVAVISAIPGFFDFREMLAVFDGDTISTTSGLLVAHEYESESKSPSESATGEPLKSNWFTVRMNVLLGPIIIA
jgi:hypothetical protein